MLQDVQYRTIEQGITPKPAERWASILDVGVHYRGVTGRDTVISDPPSISRLLIGYRCFGRLNAEV